MKESVSCGTYSTKNYVYDAYRVNDLIDETRTFLRKVMNDLFDDNRVRYSIDGERLHFMYVPDNDLLMSYTEDMQTGITFNRIVVYNASELR